MKQDLQGKVIYFPRSADIIGEKKKNILGYNLLCKSDSGDAFF